MLPSRNQVRLNAITLARWLSAPVLALALLGATSQVLAQGPGHGAPSHMAGKSEGRGHQMMGRMLDAVGASADQKAQIRGIMQVAHAEQAPQREQQKALRQQMQNLMAAPAVDIHELEKLRMQSVALFESSSKRRLQAMVDAGAVLSPAQRKQLAERLAQRRQMAQRHHQERRSLGDGKQ